ncbi:MAG: hypothetical protein HYT87_16095 [Nitrospirae bacterium]|nr:hypothetical protein [Nitrospirota bacterium]
MVKNLEGSFTGETGALTTVRDTDVAAAVAEFTKEQILGNVTMADFTQFDRLRQLAVQTLAGGA